MSEPRSEGRGGRLPEREARERAFWNVRVPSLEQCLHEYAAGPDPNFERLLNLLEPLAGATALDFACGSGVTSAWLHARGAIVTGIDISEESISRARSLSEALGARMTFVCGDIESVALGDRRFDRIAGRYALHHVDFAVIAPALAERLHPDGTAAILETMATNPLLRLARRHLVGRFGIRRLGTPDEHPLTKRDFDVLRRSFGELTTEVAQLAFSRMFDRQVLGWRYPFASRALGAIDDFLFRVMKKPAMSYHQILVLRDPVHAQACPPGPSADR